MAKMRDARAEEDAAKFEALEARCANREEAAEALRRERNALLAEVRATEKQQGKSGGGVKSGGGSNKKAGGAMTREASSEASGEETSGFLFPAKSRLGFSPKSPPRTGARRGLRLADGDHRNHAEARRDRGGAATEGIETGAIDRSGGSISPERGGEGRSGGGDARGFGGVAELAAPAAASEPRAARGGAAGGRGGGGRRGGGDAGRGGGGGGGAVRRAREAEAEEGDENRL